MIGAEGGKVGEPLDTLDTLTAAAAVVVVEFEVWPEPKVLDPDELAGLVKRFGSAGKAAEAIGASEAFVRQKSGIRTIHKKY